jgi:hypothetical protein
MKKLIAPALAALALTALCAFAADTPKTFKPDSEGFIRNWLILDSITTPTVEHTEADEKPIFAKEYFKDQLTATPKAGDKVKVREKDRTWRAFASNDQQIDLVQFASDNGDDTESVIFWGVAYVVCDKEMKDVKLGIGSDDSSVWWVNGKEVVRVYDSRAVNADDNVSDPLTLNKGVNVVRFAVTQGDGPAGCIARFLDASNKPVKDVTITLDPPPTK